jgi:hypothetical protein
MPPLKKVAYEADLNLRTACRLYSSNACGSRQAGIGGFQLDGLTDGG